MVGDVGGGVSMTTGGTTTLPGLALSSDPGCSKSISLGDCPEKLGRGDIGTACVSSNLEFRLLPMLSLRHEYVGSWGTRGV